jgi:hypothetical protein
MAPSGASETSANVVSRAWMCARWPIWSTNIEQPTQPASGQPATPGANMK